MSEKLSLIKEIENQFKNLIEVTNQISLNISKAESMEGMAAIIQSLKKREEIIQQINVFEARLNELPKEQPESDEFEKHRWLCRELAKKLQGIDQVNMKGLNDTLNQFMNNVRSTKQSIRAFKAYKMQNART